MWGHTLQFFKFSDTLTAYCQALSGRNICNSALYQQPIFFNGHFFLFLLDRQPLLLYSYLCIILFQRRWHCFNSKSKFRFINCEGSPQPISSYCPFISTKLCFEVFGFVWFLCLMAYQTLWLIKCQSCLYKRIVVVWCNSELGGV